MSVGHIPDAHIPFQDSERLEQVFEDVRGCDHIILGGDWMDAYTISAFDKNPERRKRLKDEFAEGRRWLYLLREQNPEARIDFLEGNHEDRFRRYIWRRCPELAGLRGLSVPEQLDLDKLGINYHGSSGFTAYGVRFKHGSKVCQKAGYTAHAELAKHNTNGVSVHTHRLGFAVRTTAEGELQWWWEGGHVCDTDSAEYVDCPDWQAGHLMLLASPDGVEVSPVWL